jgi:hypothetical protein
LAQLLVLVLAHLLSSLFQDARHVCISLGQTSLKALR